MLVCAPSRETQRSFIAIIAIMRVFCDPRPKKGPRAIFLAPEARLGVEFVQQFSLLADPSAKILQISDERCVKLQDLECADLLVITPEKLDLILKQNCEFFQTVRLLVVDEVEMMAEVRGVFLECLIVKANEAKLRVVALSNRIPNYQDLAHFLHVSL